MLTEGVTDADKFRERRIAALSERVERWMDQGFRREAGVAFQEMAREIAARSPEQVRRMELDRGLA
jgi:hypothetical protein